MSGFAYTDASILNVQFGTSEPDEPDANTKLSDKLPCQKAGKNMAVYLNSSLKFREQINQVIKNKKVYVSTECFLRFYFYFAKSIIHYEVISYGSAAKTTLKISENVQRGIFTALFFKNKFNSLTNILLDNKILTVFELHIIEIVDELFNQLRNQSAV